MNQDSSGSFKLSVCLITYNHVSFIRQALDSVLKQQTHFLFEIVIGDDCSTDGTSQIVEEYLQRYPEIIRKNPIAKNVGMVANWVSTIQCCRGEYIAMLEGDDFWTNPYKLQEQVHLLNSNPAYSCCAHDVEVIIEQGCLAKDSLSHPDTSFEFTLEDVVLKPIFLQTASLVFRQDCIKTFPSWVDKRVKSIDIVLYMLLTNGENGYFLSKKMSAYRLHEGGISHSTWVVRKNRFEWDMLFIFNRFNDHTKKRFHSLFNNKTEQILLRLLQNNASDSRDYRRALFHLVKRKPMQYAPHLKGFLINQVLPRSFYRLYRKVKRA
jgi:glycosyltransferase involved in cell wall biosynthesis